MKDVLRIILLASSLVAPFGSAEAQQKSELPETIYLKWHEALSAHPELNESMWFDVNGPKDLSAIVGEVEINKTTIAYFLCEKIASERKASYPDVLLLEKVAGIDVLRASDGPVTNQDFTTNLAKHVPQFAADWRQGLYKDPSSKISQLCATRQAKEVGNSVSPSDVVEIRRFGVFALPELIRQMQKHNSKHAFAAYLIITGQPEEYADYLEHAQEKASTSKAKLDHVRLTINKIKLKEGGNELEITKQISAALPQ